MRITHLLIACGAALHGLHAGAQDKPAPVPPFYIEAADCTAAFQSRVIARMAQPKSEARDQAVLRDTEMGFIFIGVAYKQGLRSPEAEHLLKAAEKRWSQLGKADQDRRLAGCTARAQQLMDDVTMIERFIVRNRAAKRVERLMEREGK